MFVIPYYLRCQTEEESGWLRAKARLFVGFSIRSKLHGIIRMRKLLYLVFLAVLGCQNPAQNQQNQIVTVPLPLDSSQNKDHSSELITAQDTLPSDLIPVYLNDWWQFQKGKNPDLKTRFFVLSNSRTLPDLKTEWKVDPDFLALYQDFLMPSPDSSRLLDLYSYRYMLEKDSAGQIHLVGNVDAEVAIFNFKKHLRQRLIFVGPVAEVETGAWVDDTHLLVAGTSEDEQGKGKLLLWDIELNQNQISLYAYKFPLQNDPRGYLQEKFSAYR